MSKLLNWTLLILLDLNQWNLLNPNLRTLLHLNLRTLLNGSHLTSNLLSSYSGGLLSGLPGCLLGNLLKCFLSGLSSGILNHLSQCILINWWSRGWWNCGLLMLIYIVSNGSGGLGTGGSSPWWHLKGKRKFNLRGTLDTNI